VEDVEDEVYEPIKSGVSFAAPQTPVQRTAGLHTHLAVLGHESNLRLRHKASSTAQKAKLDTGHRKSLPPAQLTSHMHSMIKLLDAEYHAITSHNLGVQSGTAVIEDLLVRRLHAICGQVHMLMVLHDDCADAMTAFCTALRASQLNRVQVRTTSRYLVDGHSYDEILCALQLDVSGCACRLYFSVYAHRHLTDVLLRDLWYLHAQLSSCCSNACRLSA
jgi:hypothetical protein